MREQAGDRVGQTVAHYAVLRRIGAGGMGVVYEAEDTKLARRVALKFIPDDLIRDGVALERFFREARAASALNHPDICTIYEINEHAGAPFIAMELLEGGSLSSIVRGGPLPVDQILDVAIQLTDALDAAHRKGIVHRDIKPGNIFVLTSGRVKVLDFGLAKMSEPAALGSLVPTETADRSHLTSPGTSLGTVAYMSPEQARGTELDARTDLFSAGCVLYEMATGRRAFSGGTTAVIFDEILNRAPAAAGRLNASLPGELERIIDKALEKDRDVRYQSAADFRADLKRMRRDSAPAPSSSAKRVAASAAEERQASSSTSVVSVAREHKLGAGIALTVAVVLIAAAAFGLYSFLSRGRRTPFQTFSIDKLTSSGDVRSFAISPDGNFVVYAVTHQGLQTLKLRNVPTDSDTQIVAPTNGRYIDVGFSPDANYIYFVRKDPDRPSYGYLYRVPELGGAVQRVIANVDTGFDFSPDGARLLFIRNNSPELGKFSLVAANIDGTNERVILSDTTPRIWSFMWSPDAKEIVAVSGSSDSSSIVAIDVATGRKRTLITKDDFSIDIQRMARDGSGFFLVYESSREFTPIQIGFLSYPQGVLTEITRDTSDHYGFSISRDESKLLAGVTTENYNLYMLPGSGGGEKDAVPLTTHQQLFALDWADNANLIFDHGTKIPEINTISAGGGEMKSLISSPNQPAFSSTPCGNSLVFLEVNRTGKPSTTLWTADINGGNLKQVPGVTNPLLPVCSPDHQSVFYFSTSSTPQLMRIPLSGGTPKLIATLESPRRVDVSPDGKLLATGQFSLEEHRLKIALIDVESGKLLRTIATHGQPGVAMRFSRDGKSVAYTVSENGRGNIWMQPLDGGEPGQITSFESEFINDFQWSPDGTRLAIIRGHADSDLVLLTDKGR